MRRTQHIVIFMAMNYYSKRVQIKISKSKTSHGVKTGENQEDVSQFSHRGHAYFL